MSTTIDERVVQFELENKNFERNAAQTIKTLEELDDSLKLKNGAKSFKDVEEAAERTNFNSLLKAADAVQERFSAMGILGSRILDNIADKVTNTGERLIKSLSTDQIMAGYSKYEQKTAAIQTIMNASGMGIEEVNAQLEKLNWFTDETSYSFIDMVGNIGKFTAQQVDLEEAVTAMQGIATWAAKSGQGAAEASRAMYNLSQSMGVGSVKLMDWKSIQNANMATAEFKNLAIDTAKALAEAANDTQKLNELQEITVQNFDQTLASGWFSKDVLMGVLGKYGSYADKIYDFVKAARLAGDDSMTAADAMEILGDKGFELGASAFRAAQEAKTFNEAVDATKEAVSTSWMTTFETIFGSYDRAKVMWTDLANNLYDIFAVGGTSRNELLANVFNTSWTRLSRQVSDTGISMTNFIETLDTTIKGHGKDVDGIKEKYGSLAEAFHQGAIPASYIAKALQKIATDAEDSMAGLSTFEDKLKEFSDIAASFREGGYGTGEAAQKALQEAGYNFDVINALSARQIDKLETSVEDFQGILDEYGVTLDVVTDETVQQAKAIRDLADAANIADTPINRILSGMVNPDGWELLHDSMNNFLETIMNYKDTMTEAFSDIFGGTRAEDGLYNFLSSMRDLSEVLVTASENTERFGNVCHTVFSIVDLVVHTIQVGTAALGAALRIGRGLMSDLLSYFGGIGESFDAFEAAADEQIGNATEALESARDALRDMDYDKFKENIFNITKAIDGFVDSVERFRQKALALKGKLLVIAQPLIDWATSIYQKYFPAIEAIVNVIRTFGERLNNNVVAPLKTFISEIANSEHPIQTLFERFSELIDIFKGFGRSVKETIESSAFGEFLKIVDMYLKPFREAVVNIFSSIGEIFKSFKGGDWIAIIAVIALFRMIGKLAKTITNATKLTDTMTETLATAGKFLAGKIVSPILTQVRAMASAIANLAKAMYYISQIPTDQVWGVVAVIVVLMAALTGISIVLTKSVKDVKPEFVKNLLALSAGLLMFSFAVLVLSASLKLIASAEFKSFEDVGKSLLGLFGVLAAVLIGYKLLSLPSSGSWAGLLVMLTLIAGLIAVTAVFKQLAMMIQSLDTSDLQKLMDVVLLFALMMAVVAAMKQTAGKGLLGIAALLASLAAMIVAASMMLLLCKFLTGISFGQILGTLAMFALTIAGIAALLWMVNVIADILKVDEQDLLKITASMVLLSGAVFAIAAVLVFLQKTMIDPTACLGALAVIALVVAGLILTLGLVAKWTDGAKGVLKIVMAVTVLSVTVLVVALMLKVMESLQITAGGEALRVFIDIVLLLSLAMLAMGKAAEMGKGAGVVYVLAMAAAVMTIAIVLVALARQPWPEMKYAAMALGGVMIALGVGLLLAGIGLKQATKFADKIKVGPLIAAIGMLFVLGATVVALAYLNADWKMLAATLGGMAVTLIAVALAMKIISKIEKIKIGTLLSLVISLIAVGVAMGLIAQAIATLPKMEVKDFLITLGIMLGAVAILGLIIYAFGAALSGAPLIMVGMIVFVGAILLASYAFKLFADAIQALNGSNLTEVASGLVSIFNSIAGSGLSMIFGAVGFFLIGLALKSLGEAGESSAAGILLADLAIQKILLTASAIGAAFSGQGGFFQHLSDLKYELKNSAEIASTLGDATEAIIPDSLKTLMDPSREAAKESITEFDEAIGTALEESGTEIVEVVDEVYGEQVPTAIEEKTSKWGEGSGIMGFLNNLTGGGIDLETAKGKVGEIFSGLGNMDFSNVTDMMSGNFGSALGISFGDADLTDVTGIVQGKVDTLFDNIKPAENAAQVGDQWAEDFATAVASGENQRKAESAGLTIGESAKTGADVDTSGTGANFVAGLESGMSAGLPSLLVVSRKIANQVEDELKHAWGIRSPSRVAKSIGDYFIQGLEVGANTEAPVLMKSIGTIARNAIDAVEEILDYDGSVMTITPVLDMSAVYKEVNAFKRSGWTDKIEPLMTTSQSTPIMKNVAALTSPVETNKQTTTAVQSSTPATYNFTQNNYSPKALSRIEIYRQTKNQFSGFKELVK